MKTTFYRCSTFKMKMVKYFLNHSHNPNLIAKNTFISIFFIENPKYFEWNPKQ